MRCNKGWAVRHRKSVRARVRALRALWENLQKCVPFVQASARGGSVGYQPDAPTFQNREQPRLGSCPVGSRTNGTDSRMEKTGRNGGPIFGREKGPSR